MTEPDLVGAVQRQRAAAVDERAAATCRTIARFVARERQRLITLLDRAGCGVHDDGGATESLQRHEIEFSLDRDDVLSAAAALELDGYRRVLDLDRGAQRSLLRTAECLTLLRTADATTVVRLRWRPSRTPTLLTRLVRPTAADWTTVELPTALWWAYPIVRVTRLTLERAGMRSDDHSGLEPFLSTPMSLIVPILEIAEVGRDDVVADVGCGDGRIVIEAARSFGCRAIGIEQSVRLAGLARRNVEQSDVSHLVRIECSDGLGIDLAEVTVVVLFLPVNVAGRVIETLLERLQPGARIVLHEQSPLPRSVPTPDTSTAAVTEDALTVVHRWNVIEDDSNSLHPKLDESP